MLLVLAPARRSPRPAHRSRSARACAASVRLDGVQIECGRIGHQLIGYKGRRCRAQYNQAMALPTVLYSAAQVRALDAYAIESLGVPGYTLMKRAGEAALRYLRSRWPTAYRIVIVCGSGNNGGDGYVLARFAQAAGLTVSVLAAAPRECAQRRRAPGLRRFRGERRPRAALRGSAARAKAKSIVDAVLGTGLRGAVREELRAGHQRASILRAGPVFALDVPSGLDSDRGVALGAAVRADCTVTFVGLKTGLLHRRRSGVRRHRVLRRSRSQRARQRTSFTPRLERILECGDSAGAAAPRARGAQGRLRARAHRGQRRRHARRYAPRGRSVSARRRGPRHGGRRARERRRRSRRAGPS